MKPYAEDLRKRIVHVLEAQTATQPQVAERFAVSLSFVEKVWRRWRTTGSCAAQPHAGGRQRSLQAVAGAIRAAVAQDPDITLAALCGQGATEGGPLVSQKTMCRELQQLKLPLKKSLSMPVSRRHHGGGGCGQSSRTGASASCWTTYGLLMKRG